MDKNENSNSGETSNMEMRKENTTTQNTYKKATMAEIQKSMKKCTKIYGKALRNLAKQSMEIVSLYKEHIYELHKEAISNYGGDSSTDENTENKIESILAQQYGCFGYEKYPTIIDKASMLLYFIAKGHCFKDGNKRLALYSMVAFLNINGYETHFDDIEAERVTYNAAEDDSKGEDIDLYIKRISYWLHNKTSY